MCEVDGCKQPAARYDTLCRPHRERRAELGRAVLSDHLARSTVGAAVREDVKPWPWVAITTAVLVLVVIFEAVGK